MHCHFLLTIARLYVYNLRHTVSMLVASSAHMSYTILHFLQAEQTTTPEQHNIFHACMQCCVNMDLRTFIRVRAIAREWNAYTCKQRKQERESKGECWFVVGQASRTCHHCICLDLNAYKTKYVVKGCTEKISFIKR